MEAHNVPAGDDCDYHHSKEESFLVDDFHSSDCEANHDSSFDSGAKGRKARRNELQRENLMKPAGGGVNHGKNKKAANYSAKSKLATSEGDCKTKTVIKAGPTSDDASKKRTKERTITEIIEKVSTWRKLYNGVMIPNKST